MPLNIWIPLNYPFAEKELGASEANGVPLVFVVPDANNAIKTGNLVDSLGRFYHPFLSAWFESGINSEANQFNLLLLMSCLQSVFDNDYPLAPKATDLPPLPPKPAKVLSPDNTGARRTTTGPPLPEKPPASVSPASDTLIPEKYRSPLPLPGDRVTSPIAPKPMSPLQSQEYPVFANISEKLKPQPVPEVEDLMDKMTLENKETSHPVLDEIARKVNEYISSSNSLQSAVPYVDEHTQKVKALHTQLENHTKQAEANLENLDKHISHIQAKIDEIALSNQQLGALAEVNAQLPTEVQTTLDETLKMHLDDLVTPDSALVNQLYDVVADIKAHKDTINLVGGFFENEPELINNENMDVCVKNLRGLGRDLFWLEMFKNKIGALMGLDG